VACQNNHLNERSVVVDSMSCGPARPVERHEDGNVPSALTEFEPAGRASHEVLLRQLGKISTDVLMRSVANSSKAYISILNAQRQVVFTNAATTSAFRINPDEVLGLRPGDVFSCETRDDGPDGCGTSAACSTCGAAKVLRSARLGSALEDDCRIVRDDGEAVDLKVTATPFTLDGEEFFLFTAIDISDARRREALERIFFHDIMNTATGVRGLSSMARSGLAEDRDEALRMLEQISDHLIDEIQAQRDLLAAENGELDVRTEEIRPGSLVSEVAALYETHDAGIGKNLRVGNTSEEVVFMSDQTLLTRVLGNLVKNALEATPSGGTVSIGWAAGDADVTFSVHNTAVIPREAQHQIFHRSFTTKGPGRGLGTYGARLLVERYLRGSVSFESKKESGTVFTVSVPIAPSGVSGRIVADS
jgi:signal transduction histidine kinase